MRQMLRIGLGSILMGLLSLTAGCPGDDDAMTTDSGVRTDGGGGDIDGGGGDVDGGGGDVDGGGGDVDGGADTAIADCQAAAATAATVCTDDGSTDRACFFTAYSDLCASGNAATILAALGCFESTSCRSFGDPGTTENIACLATVHDANATTASDAAKTAYCAKCADAALCSGDGAFGIPLSHLSDATNASLQTCFEGAADCDAADNCLGAEFPDIAACFP